MNKKSLIGKFGVVALSATMLAGGFLPSVGHAQTENQATIIDAKEVESIYVSEILDKLESTNLSFDLSSNKAQERTVYLDNGEKVTVGVEPVLDLNSRATYTLANGTSTWKIYYVTGLVNVQFYTKVNLSSGKSTITSAYDQKYTAFLCDITSDKLTKTSTTASYTVKGKSTAVGITITSFTYVLKASVSGKTLTTSFK